MAKIKLTPEQKRILLVLCDKADQFKDGTHGLAVKMRVKMDATPQIRETTTADALVRKGLAKEVGRRSRGRWYIATDAGYELGDGLRIEDRLGKIPARRGGP